MSNVPFRVIPAGLRLPGSFFELDNSQANTAQANQRALVIGQITSQGAATPNVPLLSGGIGDAAVQGGANSMLASMVRSYRLNDNFGEVWYLPLSDAQGALSASGAFTVNTAPTASGTLSLYIGGQLVSVALQAGMTPAAVASAIVAAIAQVPTLPVTASALTNTVNFTAANAGLTGNEIDIRVNYYGAPAGEVVPTGLTYVISAMQGGSTNPVLATALGNLGNMTFDFIVNPYSDPASLDAVRDFLNDSTGRWSWTSQLYGHSFGAYAGTYAANTTLGLGRNNQHETLLGFYNSPTPSWQWAAALAGQAAVSIRADPGIPLQSLPLIGVLPPPLQSQFLATQRESLLYDGISTFTVAQDGTVMTENIISTYQLNTQGVPDNSYLEVETLFQLVLEIRTLMATLSSKYSRCKLADSGVKPAAGSALITPTLIRAEVSALYHEREDAGFVQKSDEFDANLVVAKNKVNPNRVDILWPGTPVNQMRTFATLVQFRLQ